MEENKMVLRSLQVLVFVVIVFFVLYLIVAVISSFEREGTTLRNPWDLSPEGITYEEGQAIRGPAVVETAPGSKKAWVVPNGVVLKIEKEVRTWGYRLEYTEGQIFCVEQNKWREGVYPLPLELYPSETLMPNPPEQPPR